MGILRGSEAVHNQITITHCSPHENTLLKYFTKILYLKEKKINTIRKYVISSLLQLTSLSKSLCFYQTFHRISRTISFNLALVNFFSLCFY